MKKILVFVLLALSFNQLKAQKGIVFKIKYTPDYNYQVSSAINLKFKANLSGDTAIINKIKAHGIDEPINLDAAINIKSSINTGKLNSEKSFPIVFNKGDINVNGTINGKALPIPTPPKAGAKIYAHSLKDGRYKVDSVSGRSLKDTSEKMITQVMNSIQNLVKFPYQPLKVGDTFTQEVPFDLPIAANNLSIKIKVIYKLISVTDGNANFDMEQSLNMAITIKNSTVNLSGSGTGKMAYSIKNHFPTLYKSDLNIKFNGLMDKLNVDGSGIISAYNTYTVN
jgi:hypothetical protein